MKFANKEKTQLLDFIIGLECYDEKFIMRLDKNFKDFDTIDFNKVYKDFYLDTTNYYFNIKDVFSTPFYPMLQMLYREVSKNNDINNVETFLENIKKLSKETIRKLLKVLLNIQNLQTDKEVYKYIDNLYTSLEVKYYLTKIYDNPRDFISKVKFVFEKIYPIYLKHYEQAEIIFKEKLVELKSMDKNDIYDVVTNLLGSDKLTNLNLEYKGLTKKTVDEIEEKGAEIEIIPLLFGANRLITLSSEDKDFHFHSFETKDLTCCIGINIVKKSVQLRVAEKNSKLVLKALSDDTRFDILRMISYGFNTNKKLSELFQVSPPAITYQTNMLKEAGLIRVDDNGRLATIPAQLEKAFKEINKLLSIKGDS